MRPADGDPGRNPPGWAAVRHERVNFVFNPAKYHQYRSEIDLGAFCFRNLDGILYEATDGAVVPKKFWNSAPEFAARGVGFALMLAGQAVAVSFSSFIHEGMLELGMETKPEHRKKGLGGVVCARLIDHCLEGGREPVWSCRRGNEGSYRLALKLGFEPIATLPYYELPIRESA
jgi:GNAT superfamily N-acetyltransferase